jgi:vacuolar-type H+-ATPase subunit H
MLQLRNKIIDAEKSTEKQINEAQNEKEAELLRVKKQGQEVIDENDVKIHEHKEKEISMK